MWADKFALDVFAVFRFRDRWASLGWTLARATRARRWTVGWDGDFHHWFRLLLLLGVVRADRAMTDAFAAFGSFRFRASLGDLFTGAARKCRRASSIRLHHEFSELHFELFGAYIRVWADELTVLPIRRATWYAA